MDLIQYKVKAVYRFSTKYTTISPTNITYICTYHTNSHLCHTLPRRAQTILFAPASLWQLLQIAVTPQEEEEPLDELIRKPIHIRATGGRRASPMSSALTMHARKEACTRQR